MLSEVVGRYLEKYNIDCALVIKNLKTEETFKLSENKVFPSASIIKIFIMGEIFNKISKGHLSLDEKIVLSKKDVVPYSILSLLDEGHTFTLRELITLMIAQSENTSTDILTDKTSIESVNSFIQYYGFKDTEMQRKMIDMKALREGKNNYTSAEETADYLELLYNGKVVTEEYSKLMLAIMKKQLDNSALRRYLPDQVEIAHKTGEMWGVKHDAGIFFTPKGDYIFSMFTSYAIEQYKFVDDFIGEMAAGVMEYFYS